jgi:hypothetical protein
MAREQQEAESMEKQIASEQSEAPNAAPARPSGVRWAWEWTKSILVAFVLFLVVRAFVVEAFQIPTASMENTLLVGDFLLVNKMVYGAEIPGTMARLPAFDAPERGDIVVFEPPQAAGQPETSTSRTLSILARSRTPTALSFAGSAPTWCGTAGCRASTGPRGTTGVR